MKKKTKKKIMLSAAAIGLIVVVTGSVCLYMQMNQKDEGTAVSKEVTVAMGDVTTGISESGSITVGTISQTFDVDITGSTSSSSSSSSSSSASSGSSAGGGDMMSQMAGGMSAQSGQSSSSASSSSSDSAELEVEEVYVSVGQNIASKDKILKLTDDSVETVRKELKQAVEDASLALTSAQISDKQTKLSAKSTYDANIAAGKVAKSVYNATIQSIESNITSLKAKVKAATDSKEKESLKAQLKEAQNKEATEKLSAKQTYDTAMLNYNNAQSIYDTAMATVGSDTEDAEEALATAKENLSEFEKFVGDDNVIYAEEAGVVSACDYAEGDTLSSDVDIVTIADKENVTISVDVTQDDIGVVAIGDSVKIEFISDEDNVYAGTVTEIGEASTSNSTVSYPVTILLNSMPDTVLTGMTATVTFVTEEVQDVLCVSNKAIINENGVTYVMLKKEDNTTEKREVTTGFSNGVNVEIKDGLEEGDTVLIESKVGAE